MTKEEFEQLTRAARKILTCIDVAENEGALRWATNLRTIARQAATLSATAKTFEKRERQMNWRKA